MLEEPRYNELENLRVVLVRTRNPLNIGAAARAMSNFGARQLRLVKPYEAAFREARSAVGAAELLRKAEEYGSVEEAVADCGLVVGTTEAGRRELQVELRGLNAAAGPILRQMKSAPVAVLFGSEKVGLSNSDMSYCHWLMRIPTRAEHGSMNLGQAVAVCLYELARVGKSSMALAAGGRDRAARGATFADTTRGAASGDVERLTQVWFQVLEASGFVQPRVAAATEEKLQRMVRRLRLNEADAALLLGMLRQIGWKLDISKLPRGRNDPKT